MAIIKTGIDLIENSRLSELNPKIREKFIKRVFTLKEIEYCGDSFRSLSCRFAAKEAVVKALGCGIGLVGWQDIEIVNNEHGEPHVHLFGNAKKIAFEQGLFGWTVSLSHTEIIQQLLLSHMVKYLVVSTAKC